MISGNSPTRTLTIITTNSCTANCAHCLMNSRPDRAGELTANDIVDTYRAATRSHKLDVVVFSGGEPTTLGEHLLEAIAQVNFGGTRTRMVTNCGWATDDATARSVITELRLAGLDEINFSVDDFHAVWVPLDNVSRAWSASRGVGFESVVANVAEGPRSRITADSLFQELAGQKSIVDSDDPLPAPANDGTRYLISRSQISRLGRGRALRVEYVRPSATTELPGGACHLADPGSVLTASGKVAVCCGVDADSNSVLSGLSIREHPWDHAVIELQGDIIIRGLRGLGPRYLILLAESLGAPSVARRPPYGNLCEACEALTLSPAAIAKLRENPGAVEIGLAALHARGGQLA